MTIVQKAISQLFGIPTAATIECGDALNLHIKPNHDYVFRKELIRDLLVFFRVGRRSCMLTGHKGSGKTTLIEQLYQRIGINIYSMTGNGKTTLESLIGQYVMKEDGSLAWQDSPLVKAAREGSAILINEFNAMPEDVQLALNDIAETGAPISIPEKGEIFQPAEGFKLYATINPKGASSYMYKGRKELDSSLRERFFWIVVPYASREEEKNILLKTWAECTGEDAESYTALCDQILNVAERVRHLNKSTGEDAISEILSTRVLVNWSIYWTAYRKVSGAVHIALQRALTGSCAPEVAYTIHKLVEIEVGVPSPLTMENV